MTSKGKSTDQLVEEISARLTLVLEKGLENLSKTVETQFERALTRLTEDLSTKFEKLVNDTNSNMCKTLTESSRSMKLAGVDQLINNAKTRIMKTWNQTLSKRKKAFWRFLRAEQTANVYENWLEESPVRMQKKFQPTPVTGESEEQKQIKQEIAVARVKGEIRLLHAQATQHRNMYMDYDKEVETLIAEQNPEVQEALSRMWKDECTKEEQVSHSIWEKKRDWYLSDQQPKDQDVRNTIVKRTIRNVAQGTIDKNTAKTLTYAEAAEMFNPQVKNLSGRRPPGNTQWKKPLHQKTRYPRPQNSDRTEREPSRNRSTTRNTGTIPKIPKNLPNAKDFLDQGRTRSDSTKR